MENKNQLQDLTTYISQREKYLDEVTTLLEEHIPKDDSSKIKEHLVKIIGHRVTIATILAKLEKLLDEALAFYLPQKDKSETDLDRKYNLDANVSDFRYWRNFVENALLKTMDMQVSSMQSLLSFEKKHISQLGDMQT